MASAPAAATRAATAARVARADFKRRLKGGEMCLRDALDHEVGCSMLLEELVGAMPFSSIPKRRRSAHHAFYGARRVCEIAGLPGAERVGLLSPEEKDRAAAAYAKYRETTR